VTPEQIGARGIAAAASSRCGRLRLMASGGYAAAPLAEKLVGAPQRKVSPIAAAEGGRFEDRLMADNAQGLIHLYRTAGLYPLCDEEMPVEVVELPRKIPHEEGQLLTETALMGSSVGVRIIFQAQLTLRVGNVDQTIRPDILIGVLEEKRWWVGEMKSYLDRGGRTSGREVARACGQMAVGVLGLEEALGGRGTCEKSGDLVLRSREGGGASVRRLPLDGELQTIRMLLDEAATRSCAPGQFDTVASTLSVPCHFDESCASECGMFPVCSTAEGGSERLALGDSLGDLCDSLGGYKRALRLVRGEEAPRVGEIEIVDSLRAGFMLAGRAAQ